MLPGDGEDCVTTDRDSISRRIRALRAKTVENGCTEDEAMAAALMLSKLLEKYNMTVDEAEMRASPFEQHTERHGDPVGERLWKIADAVAFLTGSRYWTSRPGVHPVEINFFGFSHEVEVARYILEICASAMRRQQDRIRQKHQFSASRQRRELVPFLDGMVDRLAQRIRAMKPPVPPGTGLVVLHDALVEAAMKVKIQSGRARSSRTVEPGYRSGLAAGDRVALNPGLRRDTATGLLR